MCPHSASFTCAVRMPSSKLTMGMLGQYVGRLNCFNDGSGLAHMTDAYNHITRTRPADIQ